jgi:hypothetical protein
MTTLEQQPNGEFLDPQDFLNKSLGILGVNSVEDLEPRDKGLILMAFHFEQCDKDGQTATAMGIPDAKVTEVIEALAIRGLEMRDLAELLIGYSVDSKNDFDDIEKLLGN